MENENGRRPNRDAINRLRAKLANSGGSSGSPGACSEPGESGSELSNIGTVSSDKDGTSGKGSEGDSPIPSIGLIIGEEPISRIAPSIDGGDGHQSIEFSEGSNSRTPRIIGTSPSERADEQTEKPSRAGSVGRRPRKAAVSDDTASVLIQLLFGILAIGLGDHWAINENETKALEAVAQPLARILSKLPANQSKALDTYMDPIMFIYGLGVLMQPRMKLTALMMKPKQKQVQNNGPSNYPPKQSDERRPTGEYIDSHPLGPGTPGWEM